MTDRETHAQKILLKFTRGGPLTCCLVQKTKVFYYISYE